MPLRANDTPCGSPDGPRAALGVSGPVGVWDWDCVRHTVHYDRGAAALLAGDPALAGHDLHADAATAAVHLDDLGWLRTAMERAVRGSGVFVAEFRVVTADRGTRWLLGRGRARCDRDGRPVRCKGILIDITSSGETSGGYIAQASLRDAAPLDRATAACLEARKALDGAGTQASPHLRLILDMALYEIACEIARRDRV